MTERIRNFITNYASKKFTKDTVWLLIAQVMLMLGGFGINLIIGVKQGAHNLGLFNQSMAYYSILSTFIALGLNNTILKKISETVTNFELEKQIFSSALFTTVLFSVIFATLAIITARQFPRLFSSGELAQVVIYPLFALPFFNLNKNFMAYYSGKRNQKRNSINKIIRWVLLPAYIIIASFFTNRVEPMLYSFFIVELIILVGNILYNKGVFDFTYNLQIIKHNVYFGINSFVAEIISVFYESIDIILIGYFLTNSEVGVYSFLILFVKTLYIFPGIIQQNINPVISKLWYKNEINELQGHLKKIKKINFIIVSCHLLLVIVFYKLITITVKKEFSNSYPDFLIALPGAYIFALISWCGSMLVMTGKLIENNYRTLLIILFSITCTISLTYFFHLKGACIAVSLNAGIAFIITNSFLYKILRIKLI